MIDAVLFDVDGTLVNTESVVHFVDRPKGMKDFESFHSQSMFCPPNFGPAECLRLLNKIGVPVIIATARLERWREDTVKWLTLNNLQYEKLYMRGPADFRKDVIVKQEMLESINRDGYNLIEAWDDNPNIIELWESNGIPTVLVPGWNKSIVETSEKQFTAV
jgi:FMN phosphatase YigB (HAD superfamily)